MTASSQSVLCGNINSVLRFSLEHWVLIINVPIILTYANIYDHVMFSFTDDVCIVHLYFSVWNTVITLVFDAQYKNICNIYFIHMYM